jgi:hypothetical protein
MIHHRNVQDRKGVGYMTGLKYSAYIRIWQKVLETNPDARLVGYMRGEAIQKRSGGEYYTAQELLDLTGANEQV